MQSLNIVKILYSSQCVVKVVNSEDSFRQNVKSVSMFYETGIVALRASWVRVVNLGQGNVSHL